MNKKIIKKILPKPCYKSFKWLYFYSKYLKDFSIFRKESTLSDGPQSRFTIKWDDRLPCLYDNTPYTCFDRHYIYHPAWAARILAQTKPKLHIDISSTLAFSSMVSAFVPVDFYDFRLANLKLSGLTSRRGDLTNLPFPSNSVVSLSCMHTIEHVGLGRYGDPIDSNGDLKAISELKRVLAKGGDLLFVVPVGKPRVRYNAHRIYSYEQIIKYFDGLTLVESYLIPDSDDDPLTNPTKERVDQESYGCGCFWFKKK